MEGGSDVHISALWAGVLPRPLAAALSCCHAPPGPREVDSENSDSQAGERRNRAGGRAWGQTMLRE